MADVSANLVQGPAGFWILPGIYDGSLSSLQTLVCTNTHRRALWEKIDRFIAWAPLAQFSHLYFTGAMLSSEERPPHTDLILKTKDPYGPASFAAMEPFFSAGLGEIRTRYAINLRFWIENAPAQLADYRSRRAQPEAAQKTPVDPAHITVRISLADQRSASF